MGIKLLPRWIESLKGVYEYRGRRGQWVLNHLTPNPPEEKRRAIRFIQLLDLNLPFLKTLYVEELQKLSKSNQRWFLGRISEDLSKVDGSGTKVRKLKVDFDERFNGVRDVLYNGCPNLSDVTGLVGQSELYHVELRDCPRLRDVSPIFFGTETSFSQLRYLDLTGCAELREACLEDIAYHAVTHQEFEVKLPNHLKPAWEGYLERAERNAAQDLGIIECSNSEIE